MAQQMARIYERDFQSYFYSGIDAGRAGDGLPRGHGRRLPPRRRPPRRRCRPRREILIGEPDAIGYDALQDELGRLIHGEEDWPTLRVPKPVAALGAWAQGKLEPVVPDAIDQGEEPFIKPFMVVMADDHYALDIRRAHELLGWEPRHQLRDELPKMVAALKDDPVGWYEAQRCHPAGVARAEAAEMGEDPEELRARHEAQIETQHAANRWAHFANIGLGTWLLTQPPLIGVGEPLLRWSEVGARGGADRPRRTLAVVAGAVGALGLRRHWRPADGGPLPVLDRERAPPISPTRSSARWSSASRSVRSRSRGRPRWRR